MAVKLLIGAIAAIFLLVAGGAMTWLFTAGPLGSSAEEAATVAADESGTDEPSFDATSDPAADPVDQPPVADSSEDEAAQTLNAAVEESRAAVEALAGSWTAQLASGQADDSAVDIFEKWEELHATQTDSLLIWTGDWPGTFGPSNRNAWVVIGGFSQGTTEPILDWCDDNDLGCWAIRLETSGEPELNTDLAPPDDRNN